jgi:hypothetical protein
LRFLALVVVAWLGLRVALLWPETGALPDAITAAFVPEAEAEEAAVQPVAVVAPGPSRVVPRVVASRSPRALRAAPRPSAFERLPVSEAIATVPADPILPMPLPAPVQLTFNRSPSRWSASTWLTVRPGSGISAAPGGQIGGSQGGVRIAYTLDARGRVALFGRVVTPLSGRGREASVGAEWQPRRAPVRIVAEQRFEIDGGGPGWRPGRGLGLGLVAGGELAVPAGFRLETYGQAGAIRRDRIEPYADGAARATRRLPGTPISIGAGAWGAAQRGAARLDIGPSATVAVPVGGQRIRLWLDWRQRVAGDARPGSGVALTLGSDF